MPKELIACRPKLVMNHVVQYRGSLKPRSSMPSRCLCSFSSTSAVAVDFAGKMNAKMISRLKNPEAAIAPTSSV